MASDFTKLYESYLQGELSEEELSIFQEEVKNTSDDELWDLMCDVEENTVHHAVFPDDAKKRILSNLNHRILQHRMFRVMKYAAVVTAFIISAVSVYSYFNDGGIPAEKDMAVVNVPIGNKARLKLPDGTIITMNSGTQLHYFVEPHGLREVIVDNGEAFFDVAKDRQHPFHVSVADTRIEVLGTTFNVKVDKDVIETALFTGKVCLTGKKLAHDVSLLPGKKTIYERRTHEISIKANDSIVDGLWKDGYLAFDSAPLHKVLDQIQKWYGVSIRLDPSKIDTANDLLTGSFHNETLETVLRSLSKQYGFTYSVQKDVITIE